MGENIYSIYSKITKVGGMFRDFCGTKPYPMFRDFLQKVTHFSAPVHQ